MSRSRVDTAAVLGLAALVTALHAPVLGRFWTFDDPQMLVQAITQTPFEILFAPEKWRFLSSSNFTPLLTLSFQLDYTIAGLNPLAFYVHHLIALWAVSVLLYFLIAAMANRWAGVFAGALAVTAAASAAATGMLMTRHYVEGSALALGALLLWSKVKSGPARAWGAGALYFLSTLAKEVFVPLPLLFLAIAVARREPIRRTAKDLIPTGVAGVVYLVWRSRMLASAGGYAGTLSLESIADLPGLVWWRIAGPSPALVEAVLAVAIVAAAALAMLSFRREAAIYLIACFTFALLPIVPVAGSFEARYAFVPWLVVAGCVSTAAAGRFPRTARALLLAGVCAGCAAAVIQHRYQGREDARMIAEGKHIFFAAADSPPLLAHARGYYLSGIDWLRRNVARSSPPPVFLSDYGLAIVPGAAESAIEFLRDGKRAALGPAVRDSIRALRAGYDPAEPIEARIVRSGSSYSWELGPGAAEFVLLALPDYEDIPLPARGWQKIPFGYPSSITAIVPRRQQFLIVRREAGRWTMTPPLRFPMEDGEVRWSRAAQRTP